MLHHYVIEMLSVNKKNSKAIASSSWAALFTTFHSNKWFDETNIDIEILMILLFVETFQLRIFAQDTCVRGSHWGVTEIRAHPLGTVNVIKKFHCNMFTQLKLIFQFKLISWPEGCDKGNFNENLTCPFLSTCP